MNFNNPCIIKFSKIGNSALGYISVAENELLPFEVKRIYWTYFTPESVERGGHAHYELQQILVAVAGKIIVNVETANGEKRKFTLAEPSQGLYIPKKCWRRMKYSHNAVQMCIASMQFLESDYIRDYEKFVNEIRTKKI